MDKKFDVVVIGAGAVGCAVARELSKYNLKIIVLEKEADVACGTSGRNSAVVHAGFNNKPRSLMARFCVEGNLNFEKYARELDFPYRRTGKLIVAFDRDDMETLERLYSQGKENGCIGLQMLTVDELRDRTPYVNGIGAMLSSNTAIINPFLYTVALAENAHQNGAHFLFNSTVTDVHKDGDRFVLEVNHADSTIYASYVVNCAGLYADRVSAMFGIEKYHVYPCRGQYLILDKKMSELIDIPVYPAPKKGLGGLGIHVTPTSDGNIILGPSAEYIDEPDDYACTEEVISQLLKEAQQLIPDIKREYVIGQYTGIRSKQASEEEGGFRDFVIQSEEDEPNLINLIGIESPGLTASIPIAEYVVNILKDMIPIEKKDHFNACRKAPVRFRELSEEQKAGYIEQNPDYGEIICRCEGVTKAEVVQAIENPLNTVTISGIKNRTRCMTGRCQGGVCLANITDILVREYGYRPEDIIHRSDKSNYFEGYVR